MTEHKRLHTALLNTFRSGGDPYALASEFGITQTEVSAILHNTVTDTDRAVRKRTHGTDLLRKWTDRDIIEAIHRAATDSDTPPTKPQYDDAYRASLDTPDPMPAFTTIINRFGRWNKALDAAGFVISRDSLAMKQGPQAKWTQDELLNIAIGYAKRNGGRLPSISEYKAQRQPDHPSAILLRNRFGGWAQLRVEVNGALQHDKP